MRVKITITSQSKLLTYKQGGKIRYLYLTAPQFSKLWRFAPLKFADGLKRATKTIELEGGDDLTKILLEILR